MKSDIQLKESYKLYIDETGKTAVLAFFWNEEVSEDNLRVLELIEQEADQILVENPDRAYNVLVDLSFFGDSPAHIPPASIKKLAELTSRPHLRKIAVLGSSSLMKRVANLVATIAGKKEEQWFTDAKEAREWLEE